MKKVWIFIIALLVVVVVIGLYKKQAVNVEPEGKKVTAKTVKKKRILYRKKPKEKNEKKAEEKSPSNVKKIQSPKAIEIAGSWCTEEIYDEEGYLVGQKRDFGCDNEFDTCVTFEYDQHGNLVKQTNDEGCDGVIENCDIMEYDQYGGKTFYVNDENCDGEYEGKGTCYERKYDKDLFAIEIKVDFDCDKKPESCESRKYFEGGSIIFLRLDADCDGSDDACGFEFLDEYGMRKATLNYQGCTKVIRDCTYYTYYENGEVVKEKINEKCEDVLKERGLKILPIPPA